MLAQQEPQYIKDFEDQFGRVDFTWGLFSQPAYQALNGQKRNWGVGSDTLDQKQENVEEHFEMVQRTMRREEKPATATDLKFLSIIGQELCEWDIITTQAGAAVEWIYLMKIAAQNRKDRYHPGAFRRWWPSLVPLYLKLQDLRIGHGRQA